MANYLGDTVTYTNRRIMPAMALTALLFAQSASLCAHFYNGRFDIHKLGRDMADIGVHSSAALGRRKTINDALYKPIMGSGSLGCPPMPMQSMPGFLAQGCPFDSSSWHQAMVSPFGFPYEYPNPVQCYPQSVKGHAGISAATDAAGSSKMTTMDTMTWYSQQQTADSAAALAASAGMGWPVQLQQQAASANADEMVRGMLWGDAIDKQSKPQKQANHSFSSAPAAVAAASPAPSSSSQGTAAAFAAAMQSAQLQAAPSCSTGSMMSPHGMLSPAAYVHNAQQMLLQQSQQMQAMQQQQVLLSLMSQQQQVQKVHQHHSHKQRPPSSTGTAPAVTSMTVDAHEQLLHCRIRLQPQQRQPQQEDEVSTPRAMRAALGDRAFFSIRSLMMKQQETFVAQLYQLHHLSRVQDTLQADVNHEHYSLTKHYEQSALESLQCAQAVQQRQRSRGKQSAAAAAALHADSTARSPSEATALAQQQRRLLGGARPVEHDDRGAAAVASLSVHAVLLSNLPSTMRSAVSQPSVDYAAVNPRTYYVRQAPGVLRPTPMRFVGRSHGKGGSGGTASAVVATKSAGPAVSGEDTVQVDQRVGSAVNSRQQHQHQQQQRRASSSNSLQAARRAAAVAAAPAAVCKGKPPLSGTPRNSAQQQQQQQQEMPPPPPMLPEQAAQHAAAAAAQYQHKLHQQQQEAAAAAVMDAAAAGLQTAAGLNVFRPMPQIDPQFASKFLAGGQGNAVAAAALAAPRFDPHAYWMRKHYGGGSTSQQQSSSNQTGQDAAATAAAAVAAAAVASGLMGGAMNTAAAAAASDMSNAIMGDASAAAAARMPGGRTRPGCASSKQQQQQHLSMAAASGLAGLAAAAAASAGSVDPAAAAAAPRPVVHWWQDAEATFGEIGLVDPNARGPSGRVEGASSSARDGAKRDFPQQYSLQQLPHKKRVKLAAGGGYDCGSYGNSAGDCYGYGAPGHLGNDAREWDAGQDGAFKPLAQPAASKERSRVRSNRIGSSRQCESSVCSDNSASSIDNPSYIAAAAAAAAAATGELGPDADGVSLLLHMGQQTAQQQCGVVTAGGGGGRGRGGGGRGAARGGPEKSSSYAASAVGGGGGSGHSTAKSAAGILLSLSASQGDAYQKHFEESGTLG